MRNYELISCAPSLINWGVKQDLLTQKDIDNPEYCYINEFDLPIQTIDTHDENENLPGYMSFSLRPIKLNRELLQLLINTDNISIGDRNLIQIKNISPTTFVWDHEYTNKKKKQNYHHFLDKGNNNLGDSLKTAPFIENTIEIFNKYLETIPEPIIINNDTFTNNFLDWKKTYNSNGNCLYGDWDLPKCCFNIINIGVDKFLLFGHPYTKMIEHLKQNLNGESLIDNYMKIRSQYSNEEEKQDLLYFTKILGKYPNFPLFNTDNLDLVKKYIYMNDELESRYKSKIKDSIEELFDLSLGKLSLNINYNFKIFKFVNNNKKIEKLGNNIRDLKVEHIDILKEAQRQIKIFLKTTFKLADSSNKFHNIFSYFKYPASGLTIHTEYIPPYYNFKEYVHIYDKIFKLSNIINILESRKTEDVMKKIDLSVKFSPGYMPYRDDYEYRLKNVEENKKFYKIMDGGVKLQQIEHNFFKNCRVVYIDTNRKYTSFCIIKKEGIFYYLEIASRLHMLYLKMKIEKYSCKNYFCCSGQKIGNGDDIKNNVGNNIIKNVPIFYIQELKKLDSTIDFSIKDFALFPYFSMDLFDKDDTYNSIIMNNNNLLKFYPKIIIKIILSHIYKEKFIKKDELEYCFKYIENEQYKILFTKNKKIDFGDYHYKFDGWVIPIEFFNKIKLKTEEELSKKSDIELKDLLLILYNFLEKNEDTISSIIQMNENLYDLLYKAKKWYIEEYDFDKYGNYIGTNTKEKNKKMYYYTNLYSIPYLSILHIKFIQTSDYLNSSIGLERFGRSHFFLLENFKKYVDINKYFPNIFNEFNNSLLPFNVFIVPYMLKMKDTDISLTGGKYKTIKNKKKNIFYRRSRKSKIKKNRRNTRRNSKRNSKKNSKRKNIKKKSKRKSKRNIYK